MFELLFIDFHVYTCARHWHTDYIKRLMRKLAARWTITVLTERANKLMSAHSANLFVCLCMIFFCLESHSKNNSRINKRRKYTHTIFTHNYKITQRKWHTKRTNENENGTHWKQATSTRYYILYRVLGMSILMDQTWKLNKSVGCDAKCSSSISLHTHTHSLSPPSVSISFA